MVDWFVRVMAMPTSRRGMFLAACAVAGIAVVYGVARQLIGSDAHLADFDSMMLRWTVVGAAIPLAVFPFARRGLDAQWVAYVGFAIHGTFIVWLCHLLGTATTPFIAWYPLSTILIVLFLDSGAGWFGFLWMTWLLVTIGLLELNGVLPYAPLLVPRSLDALARPGIYGAFFFALLCIFGFCFGFAQLSNAVRRVQTERLGAANAALARLSEELGRANELISRYVAAQVAKRIAEGDYDTIRRHSRRRLTVFFSDIVGFTELADTMEPEDLSRILNEYLSEMTAIAESHGATVDKFIGDAVMAFFGAPAKTAARADALACVRMALAMLERLGELRSKWMREGFEETWNVRIGINTGQASVGNFGSERRLDYTAIGRNVNLAARLQTAATPGTILVSHATWLLVQEEIPCIDRGEIEVKGFTQPIRVYEVDFARSA